MLLGCFLDGKTGSFLAFFLGGKSVILRFRFRLKEAVLLAILAVSHSELESSAFSDLAFLAFEEGEDKGLASGSSSGSRLLAFLAFLAALSAALVSGVSSNLLKIVELAFVGLTRLFSLFLSSRLVSAIVEVTGF
jgi:hypothetical protein